MMSHFDQSESLFGYIAGLTSAILVYYSSIFAKVDESSIAKSTISAVILGALFSLTDGLIQYYRVYGIPTAAILLTSKYDLEGLQPYRVATFGNVDNTACFAFLVAAPCSVILASKLFTRSIRVLAAVGLVVVILNLLIDQSRTAFVAFGAVAIAAVIFARHIRVAITTAVISCIVLGPLAMGMVNQYWGDILKAVTYSQSDRSAFERIESINEGWKEFSDHPIAGIGSLESQTKNPYTLAHELPVSQAAETGIFGLIGVLSLTVGTIQRAFVLVKKGPIDENMKIRFMFALGPAIYFAIGLVASVTVNYELWNSWICLVAAFVGLSSVSFWSRDTPPCSTNMRV